MNPQTVVRYCNYLEEYLQGIEKELKEEKRKHENARKRFAQEIKYQANFYKKQMNGFK